MKKKQKKTSIIFTDISFNFISILVFNKFLKTGMSNISHRSLRVIKLIVIAASSKHSDVSRIFCKLISFGVNFLDFRVIIRCIPFASFSISELVCP